MKAILGGLLCYVFATTQSFAISGGPWGGGGGHVTVTGTYAGVLVPIATANPTPPPPTVTDDSLALFTLKITQTGVGVGTAVIFRKGLFYNDGVINAIADPDTANLTGLMSASFIETPIVGTTTFEFEYDASGKFVGAKITSRSNSLFSTSTRIKGTASLTYRTNAPDPNCTTPPCGSDPRGEAGPLDYKIKGFKQSESSS